MQAAPLQLVGYVVEQIHLDLAPGYDGSTDHEPGQGDDLLEVDPTPLGYPTKETIGELRLVVKLNDGAEEWPFYRLKLVLRGAFQLIDESPPDTENLNRYFLMTATTVLYGIARSLATQLTATSPYPHLLLPVVTFGKEIDKLLGTQDDSQEGTEP